MKTSHPEAVAASRVNPGETLRNARESKNWLLADVAAQLHLTAQALHQLETGDFDKLPGHTFARGYVRAYAKLLGMDQNRLVDEFDQFTGSNAGGSSVHSLGRIEEPARFSQNILKVVSLCLLLALGAGGFFWWQARTGNAPLSPAGLGFEHVEVEGVDGTTEVHPLAEPEDQAVAESQAPEQPAELAAQAEAPSAAGGAVETPVAIETETAAALPDAREPSAPESPAEPAPAVAPAPVPAPPAVAEPAVTRLPVTGEARVDLQFSADCWTQLIDANGKVLLSALKHRGESVELVGKAPMKLHLGFAPGVQVRLNGQLVDVAPFINGETARLTLGQ